VIELIVVFLPFGKMVNGTMLCALAVGKAAVVAMYFMHLKFESRTLGLIALTPLAIATLLVFVILPDAFRVDHKTTNLKPAAEAPAKH
jgi:caa(3)-type oxidase subunit IV